jgi:hypothetical protein
MGDVDFMDEIKFHGRLLCQLFYKLANGRSDWRTGDAGRIVSLISAITFQRHASLRFPYP